MLEPIPIEINQRIAAKQYDRAVAALNEFIARHPRHARAIFSRGMAQFYRKRPADARHDFALVTRLRPRNPAGWYNRGLVEMQLTPPDYRAAIDSFTRLIALPLKPPKPGQTDLWIEGRTNRALCYVSLGQPEKALADCRAVLARDPKNVAAQVLYKQLRPAQQAELTPRQKQEIARLTVVYQHL